LTVSGTPLVECSGGGTGVTKTVSPGALSATNAISFSFLETTGTVTYTLTASAAFKNLIFNGSQTVSNAAISVYGNFTHLTTNGTTTFTAGTNAWTFDGAASASNTITPVSGFTYDFPWTFGVATSSVTWTLANNLTLGTTRTITLTTGTLALSSYTITSGLFSSANSNTRTLNFGTGKIVLTRAASATIWDTSTITNFSVSGTPLVECQGGGAVITKTINAGAGTAAQTVSFSLLDTTSTVTYAFTASTNIKNLTLNGTQTLSNTAFSIYGNFTHLTTSTTTLTAGTNVLTFDGAASASNTITPGSGVTYNFPITFDGTSTTTWTLAGNLTVTNTRQVTLGTGILALSTYTFTCGFFNSSNSTARTIDFGTGKFAINASSAGTVWTTAISTNLTISGTPLVECSGGGGVTKSIRTGGTPSEAIAISFSLLDTSATYSIAGDATTDPIVKSLTLNGTQTLTAPAGITDLTIYGSFTHLTSGGTTTINTQIGLFNFYASSGSHTITPVATVYDQDFNIGADSSSTATWTLAGNLTVTAVNNSSVSHKSGTLSLSSYTLTTRLFSSSSTRTRTINFGTGKIAVTYNSTSTSGTVWDTSTTTGLTLSGTRLVECSGGGGSVSSITKTINTGALSEAQALNFSLLETAGTAAQRTYSFTNAVNNLVVNGVLTVGSVSLYGNYTYNNTNGTATFSSSTMSFIATSGTQTITSNGLTYNGKFNVNTGGSTVQLADNLTLGGTNQLLLTKGAFDFNNKTLTVGTGNIQVQATTNTFTVSNTGGTSAAITNAAIDHQTGTLSLGANITTTGDYNFATSTGNPSTLSLNTYTLSVLTFSSGTASTTRTLAFGTGQLALSGNATTILYISTPSGITFTGTVYINCTYTGATGERYISTSFSSEAQAAPFSISTSGTSGIVLSPTATDSISIGFSEFNNLDFTGFTGTLRNSNTVTIYGDVTLPSSGGTFSAGTAAWKFASTSGTKSITSNGRTLDWPFTFNGVGGAWALFDALTLGSNGTVTQTNGTLDLNGKTLTTSGQYLTAAGTKNLTFNGGTLLILRATAGFNNAAPTGYTTTAGVGTGEINMAATSGAKSCAGGGSTYNCRLNNSTSGFISITGNNTFTTIINGTQPTTFQFASGSTTTVTNWYVSGTAGNLVTIRSSTSGSAHTLSKSTGTVSSDYLSISDSTATGGAVWYAGANSTNGGNNTGWIFSGPGPGTESGAFLLMFN
jgi:hypothetical protein